MKPRIKCFFSFDGENYDTVKASKYGHGVTYGLGNYKGNAFTTGCHAKMRLDYDCSVKTEILDMKTMIWSQAADYPYTKKLVDRVVRTSSNYFNRKIYAYSATNTFDTVFIIGGNDTKNTVAMFKNYDWYKLKNLHKGRYNHGSIIFGDKTIIIGGASEGVL